MSNLKLNPDGTADVPLRGGRSVHIEEPSMTMIGDGYDIVIAVDEESPDLPLTPALGPDGQPDVTQLELWQKAANDRQRALYSSEGLLYGKAFVKIVNLFGGEDTKTAPVTADDMFGWALSPDTLRKFFNHFVTPLDGEDQNGAS